MALGELHMAAEYYRQALSAWTFSGSRAMIPCERCPAWPSYRSMGRTWKLQNSRYAKRWIWRKRREWRVVSERHTSSCSSVLHEGRIRQPRFSFAALLARLQAASTQEAQELLPEALALQVRLHLAAGDNLAAQRRLTLLENSVQEPSFDQQMLVNILQARLRLAQGEAYGVSLLENTLSRAQEKRH